MTTIRTMKDSLRPIFGNCRSAIENYVGTFDNYWDGLPGYCELGVTMDSELSDEDARDILGYYLDSIMDMKRRCSFVVDHKESDDDEDGTKRLDKFMRDGE